MFRLIDRYILREMVVPFFIGQAAIVCLLTGSVLYNNADVLLVNRIPSTIVVRMVLYFIPFLIHMTMPVAMAVAASLAVSRLGANSEITVMRASGVSLARIFAPIFTVGILLSVGDFYFGEFAVPAAVDRFQGVLNEIPTLIPNLQPQTGQWIIANDQSYAIVVRSMVKRKDDIWLTGIKATTSPDAVFTGKVGDLLIRAESGTYRDGIWTFIQPTVLIWEQGKGYVQAKPTKDGVLTLNVKVDPEAFQKNFILQLPMWKMAGSTVMTFSELRKYLKQNEAAHTHDVSKQLDYYFKLSVPFSCLALGLCCPGMAFRFARRGGFMGTLLSICLVFVYWNTMLLMRILGTPNGDAQTALLPPMVAAWGQNIIFAAVGLLIMRRSE